jgi:hypothetical protein
MLTVLQEKLAEAHGLAIAATAVTRKVEERVENASLRRELETMRSQAEEARARCIVLEETFGEELAEEMLALANVTHEKAADLVGAWFKAGTGPLRAWSFLAMAEAGEVATWTELAALAARLPEDDGVADLASWGLDVQRRHLAVALDGAVVLASSFDPLEPRWG